MNALKVAMVNLNLLFFFKGISAIVLLHVCLLSQVNALVYNDLRNLNVSCYPRDSCHDGYHASPAEEDETCECDAACYSRGTCCIDSEYVDPRPSTRNEICSGERLIGVSRKYYFKYSVSSAFFQVTRCDPHWDGSHQVRKLCEMHGPVDGVNVLFAIPVTNTYSGISYKNYYCALCNRDIENAVSWVVGFSEGNSGTPINDRLDIKATEDVSDNIAGSSSCNDGNTATLVYNEQQGFYGYWDYCSYSIPHFVSVTVTLSIPRQIEHLIKGCRSNLISHCAPGWRNVRIRILCGSYMGIIKGPPRVDEFGTLHQQYFRNAHCAQCNNVTSFEGYSCEPLSVGGVVPVFEIAVSVTTLFGHLLSDDGCLGNNEKFVEGLGCRVVVCINPQFKVRNGKCTPQ